MNQYIDFNVDTYTMIWEFNTHEWDNVEDEIRMLDLFNDTDLLNFHQNKSLWTGCFGGMSVITYDFLQSLNNKYDLSKLLDCVLTRYNCCSFERVIACLLQKHKFKKNVLFGEIYNYCPWGIPFHDIEHSRHLPVIKIWTGR
jgi:hypothetical protein